MFNDIFEIRDKGLKQRYFFIGNTTDFEPPKNIPSYSNVIINSYILPTDTIHVIKKKIMTYARNDVIYNKLCLWAEFNPSSVPN